MSRSYESIVTEMLWEKDKAWEQRLRLYVKPKPKWIPKFLWWKIVNLVLIQEFYRKW